MLKKKITFKVTNGQQTNNKQITTNKNDNNIYIYLLNKYKRKNKKDFREYMQKMKELTNDPDYELLSVEEKNDIAAEI